MIEEPNITLTDDMIQANRVAAFMHVAWKSTGITLLNETSLGSLALAFKNAMIADNARMVFEPDLSDVTK